MDYGSHRTWAFIYSFIYLGSFIEKMHFVLRSEEEPFDLLHNPQLTLSFHSKTYRFLEIHTFW